jgi:hypothetical protein
MDSKRVFILGAGFSKQAGMPLATELTPLLRQKFEDCKHEEALAWLTFLDERVKWLKQTEEDSTPSLNIEELFDFAHFDALEWKMGQQRYPGGRKSYESPYSTAKRIETWLNWMEYSLAEVIFDKQQASSKTTNVIPQFAAFLRANDTIVTFNYDTLVEQALKQAEKPWHYGFKTRNGQGVQILKMHGSINWSIAPRIQHFSGWPVLFEKPARDAPQNSGRPTDEIEYDYVLLQIPEDKLTRFIQEKARIMATFDPSVGDVGIAGLGHYKPLDRIPGSGQVWYNAWHSLHEADEVYVIGFSLSPFDTMARLHFGGVMCERAKKQSMPAKVVLIDPYAPDRLANFRSVFGPGVRIEPIPMPAEKVDWNGLLGE